MICEWTNEEIKEILLQLDKKEEPFRGYTFSDVGGELVLLGKGGSALVYEAVRRQKGEKKYAIKVIGFGDKRVDSEEFTKSVEIQKNLSVTNDNIVKIFKSKELIVEVDEDNILKNIFRVQDDIEDNIDKNYLKLQFILMERIDSLISYTPSGKPELTSEKLANFDEREWLKFAYDIGKALDESHKKNLVHRDVKLENVFYSKEKGIYKLGDYGVAKLTNDGMASTVAFTKGYGAPEVIGVQGDKYDNTADIYSFGMMLFVVANGLKFPESENYRVNSKAQYSPGYILSPPQEGSEELYQLLIDMCRFNPDDRYQSMEEILNELEYLMGLKRIHSRRTHAKGTFWLGTIMAMLFGALWKLEYGLDISLVSYLSVPIILFMLCLLVRFILNEVNHLSEMNAGILNSSVLILGIYLLGITGVTWWKIVFLFAFLFYKFSGVFVLTLLSILGMESLLKIQGGYIAGVIGYKWIVGAIAMITIILFAEYFFASTRARKIRWVEKILLSKDGYWKIICFFFLSLSIRSYEVGMMRFCPIYWLDSIWLSLGETFDDPICDLWKIFVTVTVFSVWFIMRNKILEIVRVAKAYLDVNLR